MTNKWRLPNNTIGHAGEALCGLLPLFERFLVYRLSIISVGGSVLQQICTLLPWGWYVSCLHCCRVHFTSTSDSPVGPQEKEKRRNVSVHPHLPWHRWGCGWNTESLNHGSNTTLQHFPPHPLAQGHLSQALINRTIYTTVKTHKDHVQRPRCTAVQRGLTNAAVCQTMSPASFAVYLFTAASPSPLLFALSWGEHWLPLASEQWLPCSTGLAASWKRQPLEKRLSLGSGSGVTHKYASCLRL